MVLAHGQTRAVVRSVTDGDSFEVTLRNARERVRLIGIDTPEASANRKARLYTVPPNVKYQKLLRAASSP